VTRRLLATAAALAAAAAFAVLPASAASAHDYLVSSDPSADSTVTAVVNTVTLTFNDRVLDLSGNGSTNLLTVTGPDTGTKHFETGCATVADTQLSAPVALGAAGKYTVTYQIVSADGHTVSSSYAFSYQPPAGAPESAGTAATACGAATTTPEPGATATAGPSAPAGSQSVSTAQPVAPASSGTDLGLVIGIAIGIVVLAVIGVVIVILTSRRKPPADRSTPGDDAAEG
jgi:copper resistance protein C